MSSSASRRAKTAQQKLQRKLEREVIALEFKYDPDALLYHGPTIVTGLTITDVHRQALEKAGHPIPAVVTCRFLIDTGADGTVVKHEFAARAELKLISDNTPLHGVGIDTTGRAYIGRILFGVQSQTVPGATHSMYVDTQIMGAELQSDIIDGLIGRDVLRYFLLSYDGKTGTVRMRYHKPERPA